MEVNEPKRLQISGFRWQQPWGLTTRFRLGVQKVCSVKVTGRSGLSCWGLPRTKPKSDPSGHWEVTGPPSFKVGETHDSHANRVSPL